MRFIVSLLTLFGLYSLRVYGCNSTVNGTTTACGNNWIRYRQNSDSFERYSSFGRRGFVKRPQIREGCLVYGPYVPAPYEGSLSAYATLVALIDVENFPRVFGNRILPQSNTRMFTIDFVYRSGTRILGSKDVNFGNFTLWNGNATPYHRCLRSDPCTAGNPDVRQRSFYVYSNRQSHDVFHRNISNSIDDLEVRVCNLNPMLTSLKVHETVIELIY